MTETGYGHVGRIPNYGNRGQPDTRVMEPPACIQNAMMTKDKKPFTYTPGGLDLSQIKTPSMARRLARQRSQEEQEQMYASPPSNGHMRTGGPPPPPPFQGGAPPPPPPPPLVIKTPAPGQAKPETVIRPIGERPEIVIPENPIGMLRKTNSPYHWEQEQSEREKLGAVPKFVEKIPSPVMQQNPPMAFSQQPPTTYSPPVQNNFQRQNNVTAQQNFHPESPVHKPEPQYPKPSVPSPGANQTPTRDMIQRQDSQFNKSPTPFGPQSNGSPISPTPNNAWRQPEKRDSPLINSSPQQRSPFSPTNSVRSPQFTPTANTQSPLLQNENSSPVYHTLPRASPRVHDNYSNNLRQSPPRNVFANTIYNNVRNEPRSESPKVDSNNPAPWRTNTMRPQQQDNNNYTQAPSQNSNNPPFYKPTESTQAVQPPWVKQNEVNVNSWKQENSQNEQNSWKQQQSDSNTWRNQHQNTQSQAPEPRYQSSMNIPVVPRHAHFEQPRQQPQQQPPQQPPPQPQPNKEVVYVTQEPVFYCQPNPGSPKIVPAWVKSQKEKTPPPEWCQRPLDGRKSLTRELVSPPREKQVEPEWVQKSNELRSAARDLSSPPPVHQTVQPTWSTKPSDNRKSLPRDQPSYNGTQNGYGNQNNRFVPVHTNQSTDKEPQLRIVIDMQSPQNQAQPPYSQPTQRIMRVLSPQLVRFDQQDLQRQPDLPSINNNQPKTRIIPIQIEGGGNEAPNRSFSGRY